MLVAFIYIEMPEFVGFFGEMKEMKGALIYLPSCLLWLSFLIAPAIASEVKYAAGSPQSVDEWIYITDDGEAADEWWIITDNIKDADLVITTEVNTKLKWIYFADGPSGADKWVIITDYAKVADKWVYVEDEALKNRLLGGE